MKVKSNFALLDVKSGRKKLAQKVGNGARIPVTITGFITHQFGNDDGTSIEFTVKVTDVSIAES